MAEIIGFTQKPRNHDNLIISHPLQFRHGDWPQGHAMMCTLGESRRYEAHRRAAFRSPGHEHVAFVPNHIRLEGGYHFTILGLFRYRNEETTMRRLYRLTGLMECVTSASSDILRTDLLRRFYQTILDEREALKMVWRGDVRHFLLPIDPQHYHPNLFFNAVAQAPSLKDLYLAIESETAAQFDLLSRLYVFYVPKNFASLSLA